MKLILIGGDLAAGKSTYSRMLSKEYKLNLINKDNLKEILGDNIYVETRAENKRLSSISFQIMKYIVEQSQTDLILESNFKQYEMDELKDLVKRKGIDVLSLKLIGDDKILHQRFLNRLDENRHYVHKSQDFTDLYDFSCTLKELRAVEYLGKVIDICCTDFKYQHDLTIKNKIEQFLFTK